MLKSIFLSASAALVFGGFAVAAPLSTLDGPPLLAEAGPAVAAVRKGFDAIQGGDLITAEQQFSEAVRLDPSLAGGYLGLAEIAGRKGNRTRVEALLRKAVEVDPKGSYTLRVWARYLFGRAQFAEAEAALRRAIAADPDSLDARLNLGEVLARGRKDSKAAELVYRDALNQWPTHVAARTALAATLAAQGRVADAEAEFERAARDAPADPDPLLALARYRASQGRFDRALQTLDRLLAAMPGSAVAHLDRGDLLLARNDVAGAKSAFGRAVQAAPGRAPGAHTRLGSIFEAQQNWREAEQSYRAALKDEPDHVPALNNLAYLYARRGEQLAEAERLARRGLELSPKQPALLDTLGWVYRAKGEHDNAALQFERAVALAPNNAAYHYHLGLARQDQNRPREAQAALRKALGLNPNFREAEDARKRLSQLGSTR
jgi:cellulose synthase operon protein C